MSTTSWSWSLYVLSEFTYDISYQFWKCKIPWVLKISIVPKFHNTNLSFKSYKIMTWHVLTSIVFTQQFLHTRVWISLHITQKLLFFLMITCLIFKDGLFLFNRYTYSQNHLHIHRKILGPLDMNLFLFLGTQNLNLQIISSNITWTLLPSLNTGHHSRCCNSLLVSQKVTF